MERNVDYIASALPVEPSQGLPRICGTFNTTPVPNLNVGDLEEELQLYLKLDPDNPGSSPHGLQVPHRESASQSVESIPALRLCKENADPRVYVDLSSPLAKPSTTSSPDDFSLDRANTYPSPGVVLNFHREKEDSPQEKSDALSRNRNKIIQAEANQGKLYTDETFEPLNGISCLPSGRSGNSLSPSPTNRYRGTAFSAREPCASAMYKQAKTSRNFSPNTSPRSSRSPSPTWSVGSLSPGPFRRRAHTMPNHVQLADSHIPRDAQQPTHGKIGSKEEEKPTIEKDLDDEERDTVDLEPIMRPRSKTCPENRAWFRRKVARNRPGTPPPSLEVVKNAGSTFLTERSPTHSCRDRKQKLQGSLPELPEDQRDPDPDNAKPRRRSSSLDRSTDVRIVNMRFT